jgi:hypothetical protein
MTLIPSCLLTGVLASIIGLTTLTWSVFFVDRKFGGLVRTKINKPFGWWRVNLRDKPLRLLANT